MIETGGPDAQELDRLVKRAAGFGGSGYSNHTHGEFTRDSWIISQKDRQTGRIQIFTQSGTSRLGRLEVIQGDPEYSDSLRSDWLKNGETKRKPVFSSEMVPMPDGMRRAAYFETVSFCEKTWEKGPRKSSTDLCRALLERKSSNTTKNRPPS